MRRGATGRTRIGAALAAALTLAACGGPKRWPRDAMCSDACDHEDVQAGYEAYATTLQRWGRWQKDATYEIRWCPAPEQLRPSAATFWPLAPPPRATARSRATDVPPSSYASDDAEAWHEITTRGGLWIQDSDEGGRWCWVPSLRAGEVRVVVRAKVPAEGLDPRPSTGEAALHLVGDVLEVTGKTAAAIVDIAHRAGSASSE